MVRKIRSQANKTLRLILRLNFHCALREIFTGKYVETNQIVYKISRELETIVSYFPSIRLVVLYKGQNLIWLLTVFIAGGLCLCRTLLSVVCWQVELSRKTHSGRQSVSSRSSSVVSVQRARHTVPIIIGLLISICAP